MGECLSWLCHGIVSLELYFVVLYRGVLKIDFTEILLEGWGRLPGTSYHKKWDKLWLVCDFIFPSTGIWTSVKISSGTYM